MSSGSVANLTEKREAAQDGGVPTVNQTQQGNSTQGRQTNGQRGSGKPAGRVGSLRSPCPQAPRLLTACKRQLGAASFLS